MNHSLLRRGCPRQFVIRGLFAWLERHFLLQELSFAENPGAKRGFLSDGFYLSRIAVISESRNYPVATGRDIVNREGGLSIDGRFEESEDVLGAFALRGDQIHAQTRRHMLTFRDGEVTTKKGGSFSDCYGQTGKMLTRPESYSVASNGQAGVSARRGLR